jgi:hypothetical protein
LSQVLRLTGGLEWREIDGEIVALDLDRSLYLAANATAARLWRELDAGTTEPRLVECLVADFGIDRDVAARDVTAFLGELTGQGYLLRG